MSKDTDMVECYGCHQLCMAIAVTIVPLADGPDDFVDVAMCDDCAEAFEKDTPKWEPEENETETKPVQTVDECASKETRRLHKLL